MSLPYSEHEAVKVACFLLMTPIASVRVGAPVGAIMALSGMEIPEAYVDPCGVMTKSVVFPTVHKVASLMYKLIKAVTLVG